MAKNKNRREQRSKAEREGVRHVQELRQGSTAQPHRSARDFRRTPKHRDRGWED